VRTWNLLKEWDEPKNSYTCNNRSCAASPMNRIPTNCVVVYRRRVSKQP
jgi:hypothetical protein